MKIGLLLIFPVVLLMGCIPAGNTGAQTEPKDAPAKVLPGIYSMPDILDVIGEKEVGVTTNHTGIIADTHLVDTLLALDVNVQAVFAPEHGFRGDRPDGAEIESAIDPRTGLPIISLYGANKKPQPAQLDGIQLMIFDIQDVGARFYTYLSTLHYVMEACAEADIPVVVLDRPNPHIGYMDGPVLKPEFRSFIGLHPVPVVYGMTIGEYARMINGEGWLHESVKADLKVIPCVNYSRDSLYELPVPPSPNLPDMAAVRLYPSLCFFEGTNVSVGRGTPRPFTVIGSPSNTEGNYTFTPVSVPGASSHPKHEGDLCRGYNVASEMENLPQLDSLDLKWLLRMYRETEAPGSFFSRSEYFDKLAGTDRLRKDIIAGKSLSEIRKAWEEDLKEFANMREPYLIYR